MRIGGAAGEDRGGGATTTSRRRGAGGVSRAVRIPVRIEAGKAGEDT